MTTIDDNFNEFSVQSTSLFNFQQEIINSYRRSLAEKNKSNPSAFTRTNAYGPPSSLINTILKLKSGPLPFQTDEINGSQDTFFKPSAFSQTRSKHLPDLFRNITDYITEHFTDLNLPSFEALRTPLPHENELYRFIYDGVNNLIYVSYENPDTIECHDRGSQGWRLAEQRSGAVKHRQLTTKPHVVLAELLQRFESGI